MEFKQTKNNKQCEMCGENATCLCYKCQMNLCDSCFKIIHSMKISSQHKKENIDYYVPIDIKCPDHPNVPFNLFCIDEKGKINFFLYFFNIELCCSFCHFLNLHNGHKLVSIEDEKLLQNENIRIDSYAEEYSQIIQKAINIKDTVEK